MLTCFICGSQVGTKSDWKQCPSCFCGVAHQSCCVQDPASGAAQQDRCPSCPEPKQDRCVVDATIMMKLGRLAIMANLKIAELEAARLLTGPKASGVTTKEPYKSALKKGLGPTTQSNVPKERLNSAAIARKEGASVPVATSTPKSARVRQRSSPPAEEGSDKKQRMEHEEKGQEEEALSQPWTTVKKRPRRSLQRGSAEPADDELELCPVRTPFRAVKVAGYGPNVSAIDMNAHLCKRDIRVQAVWKLKSNRSGSVFCIVVDEQNFQTVMKPSFWPSSVGFKRWGGSAPQEQFVKESYRRDSVGQH